jgi:hypothetical protein
MKKFVICALIFFLLCIAGKSQQSTPSSARTGQQVTTIDGR